MNFERCFAIVVGEEGVYSDDKGDRGNWTGGKIGEGELRGTKYGISAAAYPARDIKALTLNQAKAIYLEDYWSACRCTELPEMFKLPVFDMTVNQGKGAARKDLQRAAGVTVDGNIGPVTIAAIRAREVEVFIEFIALRNWRYANDPNLLDYGKGWLRRTSRVTYLTLRGNPNG